ncbi:E3 ubiquitin-protein ligase SINA-like 10 [Morella rubra]|uniref:E3 ubiquitin-protein ligase SINA-like 10 n=1 Tax=Morella rubra TaxID=262757 RepID=A0A6A1VJN1_9ROSI|nr:E3 ubiquitin-protein ligase SINA-like 10 [Morella rubra]
MAMQCENGHIACSSCCIIKVSNKCPSCFWPIGYNRCRSMEKVLEAVKISCPNAQYGCKEAVSYSKKNDHEKTCLYAPFMPPFALQLCCLSQAVISTLQQETSAPWDLLPNDGVLFVLNNSVELLGNALAVSCIGPCSSTGGFSYTLVAKTDGNSLRLESSTKNSQHRVDNPSSTGFLLIPSEFFGSRGQLKLEVCIRQNAGSAAYARIRIGPL